MQNTNDVHKIWREFLEQWPIGRLREMTLEEYTNLKSNTDDYFCHWVERKTGKLGSIQGGTSAKFGIYRTASEQPKLRNGQKHANGYVWWESLGDDVQAAFETIKHNVVSMVESVMDGKIAEIVPDQPGSAVQMKIRFLYQSAPYRLLPIFSRAFLSFLSEKYMGRSCTRGRDMIRVNLELREKYFPENDIFEVMEQLWGEYKGKKRRYWAGGVLWGDERKEDEFIANDEWRSGFTEETAQESNDGAVFLKSFEDIEQGDWFVMKGTGNASNVKVYYVGEVLEKDEENFAIRMKPLVDQAALPRSLNNVPSKGGERGWKATTLAEITNPEAIQLIFGVTPSAKTELRTTPMNRELNQILYGPPGTGKTYSTVRKAVGIVDGDYDGQSANRRFQELKRSGHIEFLTFHQSYSYEDFVEGIRPTMTAESEAQFSLKDGIFKRLATIAAYHCLEVTNLLDASKPTPTFPQLWNELESGIAENRIISLSILTEQGQSRSFRPSLTRRNNISTKSPGYTCSRDNALRLYTKHRNQTSITQREAMQLLGGSAHYPLIGAVFNELKKIELKWENENKESVGIENSADISYEEIHAIVQAFLTQGETSGYRLKPESRCPQFVLIIDEINRGNISKILGELITLLEPDKRMGAENELSVQLPYSQETFAVPKNLHLIGTMNTADKSIALVDVALRRRFQFLELSPNLSICSKLPQNLKYVIDRINNRIMLRKDRDYRIGHAYFMDVDSEERFDAVMRSKIIPLLSEYFYNDWDGLRFVLGEDEKNAGLIRPLNRESGIERPRWEWYYDQSNAENISPAQVLLGNFKLQAERDE